MKMTTHNYYTYILEDDGELKVGRNVDGSVDTSAMEPVDLNTEPVPTEVLKTFDIPYSRWKATCQVTVEGEMEVNWLDGSPVDGLNGSYVVEGTADRSVWVVATSEDHARAILQRQTGVLEVSSLQPAN